MIGNPDDIRQDQIRAGRISLNKERPVSGGSVEARPPRVESKFPPKKKFVPKGHDARLAKYQEEKTRISVITSGDGNEHIGTILARDKFTITLVRDSDRREITFYKHALESFGPLPATDTENHLA